MRPNGYKDKEIALKLNRKTTDVFAKARSLKIPCSKREWTAQEEEEIKKLVNNGYGTVDISRYLKRDRATVRRKLKKLGVETIVQNREIEQNNLLKIGFRKCFICSNVYPNTDDFFYQKRKCKKCVKNNMDNNRIKMHSNTNLEKILRNRFNTCRNRCERYGMELNITIEYLILLYEKQKGRCYYTGSKLSLSIGKIDSLSIDRINSDKGYTADNIVLCRKDVNLMKLSMTQNQFVFETAHSLSLIAGLTSVSQPF